MNIPSETLVSEIPFVAFDTETTGLDLTEDRLLDVGALRFRAGTIERTYESLVRPGRSIPEISISIHHITEAMVAEAPLPKQVLAELSAFLDGAVLLAHNAPFDMAVITLELKRQGLPVPDVLVLDSCVLAEALMPEQPTLKLGVLMGLLGYSETNDHRALPDARCVVKLFEHACSKIADGRATWGDLLKLHGPAFSLPEFGDLSVTDQWHYAVAVNAIEERRPVRIKTNDPHAAGRELEVRPRGFALQEARWVVVPERPAKPVYMDKIHKMEKQMAR